MTLYNTTRSSVIRMAVLGVSVMAVSACTDFGPHPLATGYKYQQNEYKSPAGPEPVIEKYTHRNKKEAAPAATTDVAADSAPASKMHPAPIHTLDSQWNSAADELVTRLIRNLGHPAEPVYIAAPATAEETHFAAALRHALNNHNIPMADRNAGAPYGMEYKISVLNVGQADRRMISIQLVNQGTLVHEESGIYTVSVMAAPKTAPMPSPHGAPDSAPVSIAP